MPTLPHCVRMDVQSLSVLPLPATGLPTYRPEAVPWSSPEVPLTQHTAILFVLPDCFHPDNCIGSYKNPSHKHRPIHKNPLYFHDRKNRSGESPRMLSSLQSILQCQGFLIFPMFPDSSACASDKNQYNLSAVCAAAPEMFFPDLRRTWSDNAAVCLQYKFAPDSDFSQKSFPWLLHCRCKYKRYQNS